MAGPDQNGHDHAHDHVTDTVRLSSDPFGSGRLAALRRARWLNAATIGWNAVEGVVAVGPAWPPGRRA